MSGSRTATKAWIRAQSRLGRGRAFPVLLLGLLGCLAGLLQAGCIAWVLAACLAGRGGVGGALLGFVLTALVRALLQAAAEIVSADAGAHARRRLRRGALAGILAGGPQLLRGTHSAALAVLAVDRIEAVDGFFSRYLPAASLAGMAPLLVLLAAWLAQPFAGLVLLCCGIAVPLMQALFGIGAALAARTQFLAMSRLQTRFVDRMRGIATIVLAGRAEDEADRLSQAADELRRRTMRVLRVAFLSSAGLDCAMAAAIVAIALRDGGVFLHAAGTQAPLAVPRALFALLLVPEFFAPLRSFALAYQDRAQATSCAEALAGLPEPLPARSAAPLPAARHAGGVGLVFEGVGYAWDASRGTTLEGLDFRLAAGETALLTGPSGAGKSTVIALALGLVAPARGRILIDGIDLQALSPAERAGLVSWIGQRPMLFAGSLRDNIRFARPEAETAALEEAVRVAALEPLLDELPEGLDTRIGEGGYGLSGGQAQRVAIARAALRDAPLLLLDEPTAHLDPETERAVFDSLRRLGRHRTMLIASHAAAAHGLGARRLQLRAGRLVTALAVP